MTMTIVTRRQFVKHAVTLAAVSGALGFANSSRKKIPLGVQLYSVRKDCAKDLPVTLNAIGKIGYKAVEFAGYHGRDAKTLRQLLDNAGLQCCGTHIPIETMLGEELPKTIEFNKTIGNKYLIVPSLAEKYRKTPEDWLKTADLLSEISDKLKPHGMQIGYHNHNIEFKSAPSADSSQKASLSLWESFFQRTNKDVVIQYDTGNAAEAGADARVLLKKFPGRIASLHVKPFSKANPLALIGEDELPWKDIFKLSETVAEVQWFILEYEHENEPSLVSIEKLYQIMCGWGKC